MRVEYHPSVEQEVVEALRRYQVVSDVLGEQFSAELRAIIARAAAHPQRFHLVKPGLHRANLRRFPYHFIYEEIPEGIRVILVRHNRRHPDFGMERN